MPKTERFELRLDEPTLARIDQWRSDQPDLPSRAEAMRRLVELGINQGRRPSPGFTDGEKILIMLFRELFKRLEIEDPEVNPDFLAEIIWGGHYWALDWQLPGIFHGHRDELTDLHFVLDVLEMWDRMEAGYSLLSKKEKHALAQAAAPLGKNIKFLGFDGNNESSLLSIARFLVNKMDRFSRFADRELNAHMPTLDMHRRMLQVYLPLRKLLVGGELGLDQLKKLAQAQLHPDHRKQGHAGE